MQKSAYKQLLAETLLADRDPARILAFKNKVRLFFKCNTGCLKLLGLDAEQALLWRFHPLTFTYSPSFYTRVLGLLPAAMSIEGLAKACENANCRSMRILTLFEGTCTATRLSERYESLYKQPWSSPNKEDPQNSSSSTREDPGRSRYAGRLLPQFAGLGQWQFGKLLSLLPLKSSPGMLVELVT